MARKRSIHKFQATLSTFARLLLIFLTLNCLALANPVVHTRRPVDHRIVRHRTQKKIVHHAGWAGAGIAAGHIAGPVGSATVGAAHYRKDLKAGGSRRTRAVAKIGVPIAIGAVAGPPGTIAYEGVEHRNWIKRHILHRKTNRTQRRQSTRTSQRRQNA